MSFPAPNLAIIAVCARPFAMAAERAGYHVAAFDIFDDQETRRVSITSQRVDFLDGGFDADDLWRKLSVLDVNMLIGVAYGSGLENQPGLLKKIACRFPLLGNAPDTVASVKDPRQFFPLLERLDIAYPEVRLNPPADTGAWIAKRRGGAGGTHIRQLDAMPESGEYYYQRKVEGLPVSVLFLADGQDARIIGFNEQWLAPAADMPFRYGGAVSNAQLPEQAIARMTRAASGVVRAIGLRGLNSMDFMLSGDEVLALEVNPRLSATFDLYGIPDLFERHLQACKGEITPLAEMMHGAKAHLIYYAAADMTVPVGMAWPDWAADLPVPGAVCKAGEPLCTVLAEAADAETARSLAFARARQFDAQLRIFNITKGNQV